MLSLGILRGLTILLWLVTAAPTVSTQTIVEEPPSISRQRLPVASPPTPAQTARTATAVSYLERGNLWLAKGEWDRAIADYDLAIAFDASAIAYYNRGVARQRKDDLIGALSDFNKAIELNPRYADAYFNRGAILHGQGQYSAAIGDFSK